MRHVLRRLMLGIGAMLLVIGAGVFICGHEAIRWLIAFGEDGEKAKNGVFAALAVGAFIAAIGAGLLGAGIPRNRSRPNALPTQAVPKA
ncbi:hypothetical protein PHYC_00888 [Phycisphaerales bacterium]|nr:hypothetical protein PHYC_00888 [Phycisphaerales bacterium]